MFELSNASREKLLTCDKRLQLVFFKVAALIDITVICGHRSQKDQEKAFKEKKSLLNWPNSKHNKTPSLAIDCAPYPIQWGDVQRFNFLNSIVMSVARDNNIKLIWGGNWPKLVDMVHYELDA